MVQEGSSPLLGKQGIILMILIATLVTGGVYGGYAKSDANNSIVCLSCLALTPSLTGTWSEEPIDHPPEVISDLESGNYEIVMLFFWQENCEACDDQWHDMSGAGLVTGDDKAGTGAMGEFKQYVNLYTPDATQEPYNEWFSTYAEPFPRNIWGTPMTVLVFQHEGKTHWFSDIGYNANDDKNTPAAIENLIHEALAIKGVDH